MDSTELVSAVLTSITLIGLAEADDKSQLVCMHFAARHRHWAVMLGAAAARS